MLSTQYPRDRFQHRPALRLRLAQPPQTLQRESEDAANPVGAENRVTGSDLPVRPRRADSGCVCWSRRGPCCAGTGTWLSAVGPTGIAGLAGARSRPVSVPLCLRWQGITRGGDTAGSAVSSPAWGTRSHPRRCGRSSRTPASTLVPREQD
jgi:hypothetical protein